MALLGSITYDPATAATKAVSPSSAMAALDTTNLRITFTAPANGTVMVRIRTCTKGTGGTSMIFLGVLDGSTIRGRQVPMTSKVGSAATQRQSREVVFVVTGLTPGNSYTWDAAYAVQTSSVGSVIAYGGPNDTTGDNAHGAICYEIWEATNLLAGTLYDPSSVASVATSSLLAMTAIDTTNLRLTFTAPTSGNVMVNLRTIWTGASGGTVPQILLGVLDGSTVKGRICASNNQYQSSTTSATDLNSLWASFIVTGLTPGNSYTWDAAYGVEVVLASSTISFGGPNDAAGQDAFGGFGYEIWAV